ncbi:toll/interleukin-1 receptor domain-containing protein [Nostoc sp. CHAB 5834]|nr:toll/interleukin-1 receptor domain-containing protein [Nostoc sp. CHAB 5834]
MKVFISWSGERSNQVAELFKVWLKCVIQNSNPWVSSEDIENGSWWFNEIGNQLADTSIGIICLTKENKDKPWILFEAGALTKGLSTSRVSPFLIDLAPTDLTSPLSQLNATTPNKKGVQSLVRTINASLKEGALPLDVLDKVFETYWPQFEKGLSKIIAETKEGPDAPARDDKDILNELLVTVRSFDRRLNKVESAPSNSEIQFEEVTEMESYRSVGLHIHLQNYVG